MKISDKLKDAIKKFNSEYPEWKGYRIRSAGEGFLEVETSENKKVSIQAASELLSDFAMILKEKELMIDKRTLDKFSVTEYTYVVEQGLEDLADEIELYIGKNISDLVVTSDDERPKVSLRFIGNLTSKEKDEILKRIEELMESYVAVDELGVHADIEFDNYEDIIEIVDQEEEELL